MDYNTLQQTLLTNVAEVRFMRKRAKSGVAPTRRMLCTLDTALLESEIGRTVLNFKPAAAAPKYNPAAKGLLCAWDIFVQDWRMINLDSCNIISTIPTTEPEKFWEYFNTVIVPMSPAAKAAFVNT